LERSLEKGTTVERLKITQRTAFHRAGNSARGPEFPPLDKIPEGRKFIEFLALRNSAKSFTKRCGATFCKGARNSGLAEFSRARNFIISGPRKFG
jgi:hypothetical protein